MIPNIALKNAIVEWEEKHLLLIRRSALTLGNQIGSGSFKSVYRGELHIRGAPKPVDVAISKMRNGSIETEAKMFLRLGRHPRVVRFCGQCIDGEDQFLVTEWAPFGSLSDAFTQMDADESIASVTLNHQLVMMQQISQAMEMLAASKVIHRDLAARNVLLFQFNPEHPKATSVKVSDFGLSMGAYGHSRAYSKEQGLPVRYLAPEAIERGRFSEKTDVWAFGVTMWEILTLCKIPYCGISRDDDVIAHVLQGGRLERPIGCPDGLWGLMKQCWSASHVERPSFAEISASLSVQVEQLPLKGNELRQAKKEGKMLKTGMGDLRKQKKGAPLSVQVEKLPLKRNELKQAKKEGKMLKPGVGDLRKQKKEDPFAEWHRRREEMEQKEFERRRKSKLRNKEIWDRVLKYGRGPEDDYQFLCRGRVEEQHRLDYERSLERHEIGYKIIKEQVERQKRATKAI